MITVLMKSTQEVGKCNSCLSKPHNLRVIIVQPPSRHGLEFRLCVPCWENLMAQGERVLYE